MDDMEGGIIISKQRGEWRMENGERKNNRKVPRELPNQIWAEREVSDETRDYRLAFLAIKNVITRNII